MYQELNEVWDQVTGPGSPFEITEVDVRGIRTRAFAAAPPTLRDVWLASAQFAGKDYLVYQDERITYAEAHRRVASIANWLQSQGVQTGDRVAIAMRNYPEWMLAYWAITSLGAAVVGVNAWWVGPELEYGLNDCSPKVLIADQERLDRAMEHIDALPPMVMVGVRTAPHGPEGVVPWSELIGHGGDLPAATVDPDADACIFYTSGTTGHPKGAQLTHRGCTNNIMNLAFSAALMAALAERLGNPVPAPAEDAPQPAGLITTPLFHVTANNCVAHGMTLNGGKLVHMYKWDATEALKLIEREKISTFTGVPTMARELISHPDFSSYDTSSLATVGGGGAQLQPDLVGKIDAAVSSARPNTGYGMTETCGVITSISADFFVAKPDSCGRVLPNFEAKIIDAEGREVAPGDAGELLVRGAPVIRGYLNRPEATAESITDGWLHTGDIARLDEDGFLFIVDRAKDMVLRGGENVYCAEVESTIYEHPGVSECTVFGVPDERLGEEVGVAIFPKEGASIDANALRGFCRERISSHKVPRYVWILDQPLPRNASGKFLKRELRDSLDPAVAV